MIFFCTGVISNEFKTVYTFLKNFKLFKRFEPFIYSKRFYNTKKAASKPCGCISEHFYEFLTRLNDLNGLRVNEKSVVHHLEMLENLWHKFSSLPGCK